LDVGCGCGNLVKALKLELEKKYKKPCRVFGLDYSRFAVKKANVPFVKLADCSKKIPFKPKQFDLVYVYTTLSYLPDLASVKKAIKNIHRVAKKIIIFDDVYTKKMSLHNNNYDPCRVRILSKSEWIKLWRAAMKKGEGIKISGDKIIITKK
jgi:ubiquinone/menaquinone biosynthesis C-methylase UbiE